jgi:hypothetical protein
VEAVLVVTLLEAQAVLVVEVLVVLLTQPEVTEMQILAEVLVGLLEHQIQTVLQEERVVQVLLF